MEDDAMQVHYLSQRGLIVTDHKYMFGDGLLGGIGGLLGAKKKVREQQLLNAEEHRRKVMAELAKHEAEFARNARDRDFRQWDRRYRRETPRDDGQLMRDMEAADRRYKLGMLTPNGLMKEDEPYLGVKYRPKKPFDPLKDRHDEYWGKENSPIIERDYYPVHIGVDKHQNPVLIEDAFKEEDIKSEDCDHIEI